MNLSELEQRYGVPIVIHHCEITTLCLACYNAYDGCPWSREGSKPVPGWEAIRNDLIETWPTRHRVESYAVLDCPLFKLDPRWAEEYKQYSKESVKRAALRRRNARGNYEDLEEMGR